MRSGDLKTLGRMLLMPVAGLFYSFGWVAGVVCFSVMWLLAAVRLGWQDGRSHGPD